MDAHPGNYPLLKLDALVIEDVEFHGTPLTDALEYLEQESRRLDTSEADPEQRGVSLWLVDAPALEPCAVPGLPPPVPRVTLTLRGVTLGDAIAAVAAAALMRSLMDGAGVRVVALEPMDNALGG